MGTEGWSNRERGSATGGPYRKSTRWNRQALRLAASAILLGPGCINVLGDVNLEDAPDTDIRPVKTGGDSECSDAGLAAGTCVLRCEPGLPRCIDNLLQRCNDAGSGWILVDQCASAALCDPTAMQCTPPRCAVSENRCTDAGVLEVCRADRTDFEFVQQCTSAAFCQALPGRSLCDDEPCRAGRQRCNGPQIEQCREDRSGYDVLGEPCASAALCVEGETAEAICKPPVCEPGTFICDGTSLSRCSDDANRYIVINECATPQLCVADQQRCDPPVCPVGAQRCTGNVLERCNAAQTDYAPIEVCATAALCDPAVVACLAAPPPNDLPDPSVLDGADYDFIESSSTAVLGLGPLVLRLPQQWSDVDRSAWTNAAGATIGPRFIASTNAARFARSFDIPGVYFAATATAPVDVVARQREFDLSTRCTPADTRDYEDDLYVGKVQNWTNCGATKARTSVVVAIDKDAARFVTVVIVTTIASRDDEALKQIWDSFVAD